MKRLVERFERIQTWITFGFVSVIAVCVTVQVFVRYVVQKPLFLWTEELVRAGVSCGFWTWSATGGFPCSRRRDKRR